MTRIVVKALGRTEGFSKKLLSFDKNSYLFPFLPNKELDVIRLHNNTLIQLTYFGEGYDEVDCAVSSPEYSFEVSE